MLGGTGYNVIIGFDDKANAQSFAKEIREKYMLMIAILKVEEVE